MGWDGSPGGPWYRAPTVLIMMILILFIDDIDNIDDIECQRWWINVIRFRGDYHGQASSSKFHKVCYKYHKLSDLNRIFY